MKRIVDIVVTMLILLILGLPIFVISLIIKLCSDGSVLHWSKRVGAGNDCFMMPKFRTMVVGAPDVATHLLNSPEEYITSIGRILRKLSLDELPQLYCVLFGKMSLVGPRPALHNQADLVELRTKYGVEKLLPGITGWAQINGRDELSIDKKVEYDTYYMSHMSILFDIKILLKTLFGVVSSRGVVH